MYKKKVYNTSEQFTHHQQEETTNSYHQSAFQQTPINTQPQSTSANIRTHTLSVEDFMESQEEKKERDSTLHKLFNIMMSTYSLNKLPSNETTIKEFKEIFTLPSCEIEHQTLACITRPSLVEPAP